MMSLIIVFTILIYILIKRYLIIWFNLTKRKTSPQIYCDFVLMMICIFLCFICKDSKLWQIYTTGKFFCHLLNYFRSPIIISVSWKTLRKKTPFMGGFRTLASTVTGGLDSWEENWWQREILQTQGLLAVSSTVLTTAPLFHPNPKVLYLLTKMKMKAANYHRGWVRTCIGPEGFRFTNLIH